VPFLNAYFDRNLLRNSFCGIYMKHDIVREAVDRHNFSPRAAAGTIEGHPLLVEELDVRPPKLQVRYGGELDTDIQYFKHDYSYSGGVTVSQEFQSVETLRHRFDDLVQEYNLEPIE
jgi:hypothetical protein